ncbi:MAG: D-aminoacyl-tRNA deacylase [Deltaproteobacteria bacterium]|nr:D-aminoacyl-tRNA deacylase [Deltaproteobacteria bacterium]
MRAVVQRVRRASVSVGDDEIAAIGAGLLILVGVARGDTIDEAARMARRCAELRLFADEEGKLNRSLLDVSGEALVVSQFTLLGDTRKGRRPNFMDAAPPAEAEPLVEAFAVALRQIGAPTKIGRFGAMMDVALVNDGPVTLLMESRKV